MVVGTSKKLNSIMGFVHTNTCSMPHGRVSNLKYRKINLFLHPNMISTYFHYLSYNLEVDKSHKQYINGLTSPHNMAMKIKT